VQRNRLTTALFDSAANTQHIESAYLEMYKRYQESLEPEDFMTKFDKSEKSHQQRIAGDF
jgi:hypothetical protein